MEVTEAWRSQGPAEQLSKFGMRTSPASAGATRTGDKDAFGHRELQLLVRGAYAAESCVRSRLIAYQAFRSPRDFYRTTGVVG
jgi:hypothetical protein